MFWWMEEKNKKKKMMMMMKLALETHFLVMMMTKSVKFAQARCLGYCCRIDCITVCQLQAQCQARGRNSSRVGGQ